MSIIERIRGVKEDFQARRQRKFDSMVEETARMDKEAKIRSDYEKARSKLSKAKKMRTDRMFAPLKKTAKRSGSVASRVMQKAKSDKSNWELKSLI